MEPILRGLSILVVDDDPDAREMLEHALGSWGADVRVVGSAGQARSALATQTPDVIVSDIGMPDEDGYSLLRSVRALASFVKCSIPAVALTAFSSPAARDRAMSSGFDVYLVKPIQPWILAQILREITSAPSGCSLPPS
jgi:CheY-like chemotaxis protein